MNIVINMVTDIDLNIISAVCDMNVLLRLTLYFMYFIYFLACFRADLWFLVFLLLEDGGDLDLPVHYTLLQPFYVHLIGQ